MKWIERWLIIFSTILAPIATVLVLLSVVFNSTELWVLGAILWVIALGLIIGEVVIIKRDK